MAILSVIQHVSYADGIFFIPSLFSLEITDINFPSQFLSVNDELFFIGNFGTFFFFSSVVSPIFEIWGCKKKRRIN